MSVTAVSYKQVEDEALHLPHLDRTRLASRLLESLDNDDIEPSPEWRMELQQRVQNIDSCHSTLIPSEEIWQEVEERFESRL